MDLKLIRYFLHLAQTEHVSQTADFLNISQPSLSKNIAALERELGLKLFDRVGNHVKLNKNGSRFADCVRQSIELLDAGILSAKSTVYEVRGDVSISCWAFAPIILACTNEYTRLNPLINFKIRQAVGFDEGDSDFILCASEGMPLLHRGQCWISHPLFKEKFDLIFAPEFRDMPKDQVSVDLAAFRESPFVTMYSSGILFNDITYKLCQQAGFFPKTYCQTDDFLIKMTVVSGGHAVAFIPECCLEIAQRVCPELRHFYLENINTQRTVSLMRRKKVMMSEAALDFWDFTLDYYGLPPDKEE